MDFIVTYYLQHYILLIYVKLNEAPFEVAADEQIKEVLQHAQLAKSNNGALDPEAAARAPWKRNLGIGLMILIILILIIRFAICTSSA